MAHVVNLQEYRASLRALARAETERADEPGRYSGRIMVDVPAEKINRLLTQLTVEEALRISLRMKKGADK